MTNNNSMNNQTNGIELTSTSNGNNKNSNGNHANGNHVIAGATSSQRASLETDAEFDKMKVMDNGDDSADHHHGVSLGGSMGGSETAQITVNIIISFVGAGLLGIPYAYSRAGWLLGTVALFAISALNVYAMLLLPKVRRRLQAERGLDCNSYGTMGRVLMGDQGGILEKWPVVAPKSSSTRA